MSALLLLVALATPVDALRFTAWGKAELAELDRRPYYLTREALLALPVPPPPQNSDAATRADLDELLRLQRARTAAERDAIDRHRPFTGVCRAFFDLLGRPPASLPLTRALLEHVDRDAMLAVFHAKHRFNRARPHQLEPRLQPSIPVPAHAAYPSGHALQGHVVARVLAQLAPDRRAALVALGEEIGHEREIAGVHYAGDSAASRALGDALYALLAENAKFRAEVEAARAEWR
jgi:acid phosphatase (class A)